MTKKQSTMLTRTIALLETERGNWPEISEDTGIPKRTIENIVQGVVKHPSVNTVETLYKYLTEGE